jgi:hypothetical protein
MCFRGMVYRKGIPWLTVTGELREKAGRWEGTFLTSGGFYARDGDRLELRLDDGRRVPVRVLGFEVTRDWHAEVRVVLAGPVLAPTGRASGRA